MVARRQRLRPFYKTRWILENVRQLLEENLGDNPVATTRQLWKKLKLRFPQDKGKLSFFDVDSVFCLDQSKKGFGSMHYDDMGQNICVVCLINPHNPHLLEAFRGGVTLPNQNNDDEQEFF